MRKPVKAVVHVSHKATSRFDPEILEALYSDSPQVSHNKLWRKHEAADARMLRKATVHAQTLRDQAVDPGDAYLQGVTHALEALRLQIILDAQKSSTRLL